MADLEPDFELEDALTDHPPEIEPEIKRDFISSLEAEPYDDVIGETCDKKDYVPLLDDEEAKAGNQESKSKLHADGTPVEGTVDSKQAVLENGDHEIGEIDATESSEVIVGEKSYSEFMSNKDPWAMEKEFGFDPQPVFQLIHQPDPFVLDREDDLSDLLLPPPGEKIRPAFTEHFSTSDALAATMVPEGCLLDNPYSLSEMDATALTSLDPASGAQPTTAAPAGEAAFEADWLEAQRRHVEGAETLIDETSETATVTPGDTPSEESLKQSSPFPKEAMKDDHMAMVWQPTEQEQLALDRRCISDPPRRAEDTDFNLPEVPAAFDVETEFTDETKAAVIQHTVPTVSSETPMLIECNEPVSEHVPSDVVAVPAGQETTERLPQELPAVTLPLELAAVTEDVKLAKTPEQVEPSAPPFDLLTEVPLAMKQHVEPPQEPEAEKFPESKVCLPEAAAAPALEGASPKEEEKETELVGHTEPAQDSAASIRQTYKPSDRRAKPAAFPVSNLLEEVRVGLPQQKSLDPTLEVESGSVTGMASRTRALHKKAAELAETRREMVKDVWDAEGAPVMMKRKKRKPKQKKSTQPKAMEQLGNVVCSNDPGTIPSATEVQKSDVSFVMPAESGEGIQVLPCSDMGMLGVQNISSTTQPLKSKDLLIPVEDSKKVGKEAKGEAMKDDRLVFQSESQLNQEPGELLESSGEKTNPEPLIATQVVAKSEGTAFKGKSKSSSEHMTAVSECSVKGAGDTVSPLVSKESFIDSEINQFASSVHPVKTDAVEEQAHFGAVEDNTESINVHLGPIKYDQNQNVELPVPGQPVEMDIPKVQVLGGAGKASKPKKSRGTDKRKKVPESLESSANTGSVQGPAVTNAKDRAEELGFIDLSPDVKNIASEQPVTFQTKEDPLGAWILPGTIADVETRETGFMDKTKVGSTFMECMVKDKKDEPAIEVPIVALMDNKTETVTHAKNKADICMSMGAVNVEKAATAEMQGSVFGKLRDTPKDRKEIDFSLKQVVKSTTDVGKAQIQVEPSLVEKERVSFANGKDKGFKNIPSEKPVLLNKASTVEVENVDLSLMENRGKESGFYGNKKTQRGSLKRPRSLDSKAVKIQSVAPLEDKVSKDIEISKEPSSHLEIKVETPSVAQTRGKKTPNSAEKTVKVEGLSLEHADDVGIQRNVSEPSVCMKTDKREKDYVDKIKGLKLIQSEPLATLDVTVAKHTASTECRDYGKTKTDITDQIMAIKSTALEFSASVEIEGETANIFTLPSSEESPKETTVAHDIKEVESISDPLISLDIKLDAPKIPCIVPVEDKTKTNFPCERKVIEFVSVEHPATLETKADAPKFATVTAVEAKMEPGPIDKTKALDLVSLEHPATLEVKADAPILAPVAAKTKPGLIDKIKGVDLVSGEHPATLEMKADAPIVAPVVAKTKPGLIDKIKGVDLVSLEHPATLEMKADAPILAPVAAKTKPGLIDKIKGVDLVSGEHPATLEMKADAPIVAPVVAKTKPGLIDKIKGVDLVSGEHPATLEMKADAPVVAKTKPGLIDKIKGVDLVSLEHPATLEMKADAPILAPVAAKTKPGLIDKIKGVDLVSGEHPATLEMKADAPIVAPVVAKTKPGLIDKIKGVDLVSGEHPATLEMKADAPIVAPVVAKTKPGLIDKIKGVDLVSMEHPATLEMKADAPIVAPVVAKTKPGLIDKIKGVDLVSGEHPATLEMKADAPILAPVAAKTKPGLVDEIKAVDLVSGEHPATLKMKTDALVLAAVEDEEKTKTSIEKISGINTEHSVSLENEADASEIVMPTTKEKSEERSFKTGEVEHIPYGHSGLKSRSSVSTGKEIKVSPNDKGVLESDLNRPYMKQTLQEGEGIEHKKVKEPKEKKARAPEQIKGYMRPTKSRGVAPSLRPAILDGERSRQPKDSSLSRQRQEKEKAETLQPHEGTTGADITAPPQKELPPSPEKKAKPSTVTPSAKPAPVKNRPLSTSSPKRPASATTPTQTKKPASPSAAALSSTPKRPLSSTTRLSSTPRDLKAKIADSKGPVKSPEKRTPVSKTPTTAPGTSVKASPVTPRTQAAALADTSTSMTGSGQKPVMASASKRPTSIKTDVKPAETKRPVSTKSSAAELSRPKTSPVSSGKSNATTPTTPGGTSSTAVANRPKSSKPAPAKPASNSTTDTKKLSTLRAPPPPKPSTVPKQTRPASAPPPDLKNIRSKIGSTDNIKHQPGGGKAKVTKQPESANPARKCEPLPVTRTATSKTAVAKESAQKQTNGKAKVTKQPKSADPASKCEPLPVTRTATSKTAVAKESAQKQTNGKVPNSQKPTSGSRTQSTNDHKPSTDNTSVLIQNKKVDMSKVVSKCGSKTNIKHKPGGGDVKIESHKVNVKGKVQSKVGSLDNVGHVPAGGGVKTEGSEEAGELAQTPENGDLTAPQALAGSETRENGVGEETVPAEGGDQREIQSFSIQIQETSI
ncbi:microtubule-associated protein 4 isoform X4 [Rhinatrema bivittatum]|uniref:microtubule-associated protein 4 isoform X4 n=1 Tax=Rhinatrema bivittatum TaxID=194408 RepID=UPI001125F6CA|nr:microtubule-associated protein 4 isoform X4 [Rhinatrema bivittatum]